MAESLAQPRSWRTWSTWLLNTLLTLCCLLAFAGLIYEIGWTTPEGHSLQLYKFTHLLLAVFAVIELVRLLIAPRLLPYLRNNAWPLSLAALALIEVKFHEEIVALLHGSVAGLDLRRALIIYLGLVQVSMISVVAVRALRSSGKLAFLRLPPAHLFGLSFLTFIAIGTCLLKMPNATVHGITWLDAAFTATSAVCVTGLVVLDTSKDFTLLGQGIILGLIQIGGLGVMTITYFFATLFSSAMSLRERMLLKDLLSDDNLGQITWVLFWVVTSTFAFEAIGAWFIHGALVQQGVTEGALFHAVFHSVSAYCNAGFSTFSANLAEPMLGANIQLQLTIMGLIVLGGLGFPVIKRLFLVLPQALRWRLRRDTALPRLGTHVQLVLGTTAVLIVAGAVLIYCSDYVFADERPHAGGAWLTSFFNSITARTAGFNTVDVAAWSQGTVVVMLVLMLIGGSPGGTAGGIKTTTYAICIFNGIRILREQEELEVFGRRLDPRTARTALAILLLALGWIFSVSLALIWLVPERPALDLIFETVSAFATVGLSRNLTPLLPDTAKLLLILTMFAGRLGILVFASMFVARARPTYLRRPTETILLS